MPRPVFRFAPSPNGFLHLGHAYSALCNAAMAGALGGRFLLRIEDIDRTRCRPEYEAAIFEDLAWLGLTWEEPVRRQSDHLATYRVALARLETEGLVYPSFETRAEIAHRVAQAERGGQAWPRDPDGAPRFCASEGERQSPEARAERIASGAPYAIRLDARAALARTGPLGWTELGPDGKEERAVGADPAAWGDVVLARKETPTSYHLSVVIDDALQDITHVVRGEDLFHATSVHRLLQALLGLPAPRYRHHRLILGADGRKLSKSAGAPTLRDMRAAGATPADIRNLLGIDGLNP